MSAASKCCSEGFICRHARPVLSDSLMGSVRLFCECAFTLADIVFRMRCCNALNLDCRHSQTEDRIVKSGSADQNF